MKKNAKVGLGSYFVLMISLFLLHASYTRIKLILSLHCIDYYEAHFGNVGLLYGVMGFLLLTLFFILVVIEVKSKQ